jgi:hypothetical protein
MGQFKPMVKMETTEPSVELKLKKGGKVSHKDTKKSEKGDHGHKPMAKKADGGILGALASQSPMVDAPMADAPARGPKRPALSLRRKAMSAPASRKEMAKKAMAAEMAMPMRKKGGEVESKDVHKAEMKKINKVESELKSHEGKAASKAHKGLACGGKAYKTGGVVKGNGGGYKTGGVVNGQGGFKDGGSTGDVKLGNAGGYKKGGGLKKFASGGSVDDSGRAQKMPQGNKKPSSPVAINMLSGTFKKGGKVKAKKYADGGPSFDESFASPREQLAEMRRQKNIVKGEGAMSDADRKASEGMLDSIDIPAKLKSLYNKSKDFLRGQGSVTDTERTVSRTVSPAKKCGGKIKK